ncbi:MalY/PatB family protein [Alloscardovia criceti]|uniref:MalY/PatB family protein n=1 Tax=Alloscardovia criceti TaxID=356828 RepID=UPI00037AED60|nr:MalY/PatB family protein [Alloscardovia criceti]
MSGSIFDEAPDRRNTYSMKWNVGPQELPMWVADMDFKTAPVIIQALEGRVTHGVFGYTEVPEQYYESISRWWSRRHQWTIDHEWIALTTGVVPAISSMVRSLTTPGDKVVVLTPVYNIFFNSIINSGRVPSPSALKRTDEGYEVDWADLETRLSDSQATLLILCNPQNPTGTIWDKQTLAGIGELCATHGVRVISDEIHCEIVAPGYGYIPFASASPTCAEISATCISPTKAFNIAGLQTASVVVPNPEIRDLVVRGINRDEVAEPNAFAVDATIAAFTHGEDWLDELREYLFANKRYAADEVSAILGLSATATLATYLLWIDATPLGISSSELVKKIREKSGLILSDGESYGATEGAFLRMNLACPRNRVSDGIERLKRSIETLR